MQRDKLYYENRIHMLESRSESDNRALINKLIRQLRKLEEKEETSNGLHENVT